MLCGKTPHHRSAIPHEGGYMYLPISSPGMDCMEPGNGAWKVQARQLLAEPVGLSPVGPLHTGRGDKRCSKLQSFSY
jgi:hypothetical protein